MDLIILLNTKEKTKWRMICVTGTRLKMKCKYR